MSLRKWFRGYEITAGRWALGLSWWAVSLGITAGHARYGLRDNPRAAFICFVGPLCVCIWREARVAI